MKSPALPTRQFYLCARYRDRWLDGSKWYEIREISTSGIMKIGQVCFISGLGMAKISGIVWILREQDFLLAVGPGANKNQHEHEHTRTCAHAHAHARAYRDARIHSQMNHLISKSPMRVNVCASPRTPRTHYNTRLSIQTFSQGGRAMGSAGRRHQTKRDSRS